MSLPNFIRSRGITHVCTEKEPPGQLKATAVDRESSRGLIKRGKPHLRNVWRSELWWHRHSNVGLLPCLGVRSSWICGESNCAVWHVLSDMVKWREDCLNHFILCTFQLKLNIESKSSNVLFNYMCLFCLQASGVEEKLQLRRWGQHGWTGDSRNRKYCGNRCQSLIRKFRNLHSTLHK